MKLAFLILGHRFPEQIIRLIETLRIPDAIFVVHIDRRADESVMSPLVTYAKACGDIHLAARQRCYWGQYGIAQATIECMHTLLAQGREFDYAMLLSGSDYPIKTMAEIVSFLEANKGREFIEAFALAKPNRWSDGGGMFQALARVKYWTINIRSHSFQLKLKRSFYGGWEPHGGSQWWTFSREAVVWMVDYLRANPALARYFKFVFIPDESLFQSMIANSPFQSQIYNDDLRYIDWERPNPMYPRTLDDEDFDRLAASPKLFARKLEPERSKGLLDRLDRELLRSNLTAERR
jgi:Core-2/I-Branching enzyme